MGKPIRRKIPWDDDAFKKQREKKALLPENTIYAQAASPSTRRDMMLLGTMLWTALDSMMGKENREKGLDIAGEIVNHVMRALEVMMKNVSLDERKLLAQVLVSDADTCLRSVQSEDARGAVLAVCHLIVKLTDEGLIPDPGNNVVLAALGICEEAAQDGIQGPWRYIENEVVIASQRLWDRAQLAGYLGTMIPTAH